MSAITLAHLIQKKRTGERFACLTAYDASMARLISAAGIEVLLVGDSLGMVIQGDDSTLKVKLRDIKYHLRCVCRGNRGSLLIGDLPLGTYGDMKTAVRSATALIQAGAHMVKMEGGDWLCNTVARLYDCGIPVCAHLGLQPQSINLYKGYSRQATALDEALILVRQALALEQSGAQLIVVEHIPSALGAFLQQTLTIPVIGIGAGPGTDAQILVVQDILGLSPKAPPFAQNFLQGSASITEALEKYRHQVVTGKFPPTPESPVNSYTATELETAWKSQNSN